VVPGLARSLGLVADWRLDTLVVRAPLEDSSDDRIARSRRVVFGDNLLKLGLRRNLNPVRGKAVLLRATNPATREVTEARWPPVRIDGERDLVYPMRGSWSVDALRQRARGVYRSFERRQLEGSMQTTSMADIDDLDLLDLEAGDLLEVRVRSVAEAPVLGMSRGELAAFLKQREVDDKVAEALASAWVEASDLLPLYFARRTVQTMTRADGYTLAVDLENVISE